MIADNTNDEQIVVGKQQQQSLQVTTTTPKHARVTTEKITSTTTIDKPVAPIAKTIPPSLIDKTDHATITTTLDDNSGVVMTRLNIKPISTSNQQIGQQEEQEDDEIGVHSSENDATTNDDDNMKYSKWSDWTQCDHQGGRRIRRRKCLVNSRKCHESLIEVEWCDHMIEEGNINNNNHPLSLISRRSIIVDEKNNNNNDKYRTTRCTSLIVFGIGMGNMGRQMSSVCQWPTMSESSDDRIRNTSLYRPFAAL